MNPPHPRHPDTTLPHLPHTQKDDDMTTLYDRWLESGAALHAAKEWCDDDRLLDAYLDSEQAFIDLNRWCDDQLYDRHGDRWPNEVTG